MSATFSTITRISGYVEYQMSPMMPPLSFEIPIAPAPTAWRLSPNSLQSYHTSPLNPGGPINIVAIMFRGTALYPGLATIPNGTGLVSVERQAGSHMATVFRSQLEICGVPKPTQTCATLKVSQAPGTSGRFSPTAQIPANFPIGKKIVSLESTNITVAAFGGKPAETQAITTPFGPSQPKTANFPIAFNNRHVRFFSVNANHETAFPVDTWRAQAGQGQHYLTIGENAEPGQFISPVNSWQGGVGAVDTPAHGNVSGDVKLCVQ